MQSFKALSSVRRTLCIVSNYRSLSAQPSYTQGEDLRNQILVEGKANARAAILNRPSSLNALTTTMAGRLKKLYESWEDNPDIGFVIMKGSGRAFCAGGDMVTLCKLLNQETEMSYIIPSWHLLHFETYGIAFRLHAFGYVKTDGFGNLMQVAILDGITMGGGAGVSIPGTFRVATDKTGAGEIWYDVVKVLEEPFYGCIILFEVGILIILYSVWVSKL
ncbi:hypothetical protein GIB67_026605 [Kingdonia uniflora]|uniref:3-hydroxyisobutyryl-CoA hydrolase n=1 Tax=Kingdonia uniflora TaxID=39325 RepID=A0A7J7KVB2_9MAGN|nr:hypothetical protein GIB67_026605 [Kingdonia uniflora]